jgi:hypothetical protein
VRADGKAYGEFGYGRCTVAKEKTPLRRGFLLFARRLTPEGAVPLDPRQRVELIARRCALWALTRDLTGMEAASPALLGGRRWQGFSSVLLELAATRLKGTATPSYSYDLQGR